MHSFGYSSIHTMLILFLPTLTDSVAGGIPWYCSSVPSNDDELAQYSYQFSKGIE